MAPKTVQQLFGLKEPELNALAVLAGLEGYRGGAGQDVAAVASNALARRISGRWGGTDIRNIAKAPGQYVAVDKYSMEQLADPAFGAKVLGGQSEFEKIRNIVNNPVLVGEQFRRSKGAQSFRGVSAYENKKPEDYMPVPGKSNFYFNALDPGSYKKGQSIFGQAAPPAPILPDTQTAGAVQKGNQQAGSLLQSIMKYIPMAGTFPGLSSLSEPQQIRLPDSQDFLNAYKMFFNEEEDLV